MEFLGTHVWDELHELIAGAARRRVAIACAGRTAPEILPLRHDVVVVNGGDEASTRVVAFTERPTCNKADVTSPTGSDHDLLTIIAALRAKPGKEQQLRQAAEAIIEPTRRQEGCIAYHLHQGIDDPRVFYFYENWASPEALDAHMKAPISGSSPPRRMTCSTVR